MRPIVANEATARIDDQDIEHTAADVEWCAIVANIFFLIAQAQNFNYRRRQHINRLVAIGWLIAEDCDVGALETVIRVGEVNECILKTKAGAATVLAGKRTQGGFDGLGRLLTATGRDGFDFELPAMVIRGGIPRGGSELRSYLLVII